MDDPSFSALLKQARGLLTTTEAAERGRCTPRAINWWEGGTKLPKMTSLLALLDGYGIGGSARRTVLSAYTAAAERAARSK